MTTYLTIKTYPNSPKSIETAENDLFQWQSSAPDMLTYKPTGQQIYQMNWYVFKNSRPITDQAIVAAVNEFWAALDVAKETLNSGHQIDINNNHADWYHYNEQGERELNEDY